MLYGFSRDGAVPFSETWMQVDKASGVPLHAGTAVSCLPALHAVIRHKPAQMAPKQVLT